MPPRSAKKQRSAQRTTSGSGPSSILHFFAKTDTGVSSSAAIGSRSPIRVTSGSVVNPVVISDDEECVPVATKRQRSPSSDRITASPAPVDLDVIGGHKSEQAHDEYLRGDGSQLGSDEELVAQDGDGSDAEADGLGLQVDESAFAEPIEPDLSQPSPVDHAKGEDGAPAAGTSTNAFDLPVEWDEGDDEGMGMEDFGDDEGDDDEILATPKSSSSAGPRMGVCPVCGASLHDKANTLVQQHINTCLDAGPSTVRPITSFSHAEPSVPSPRASGANAFSVLMSGHKEKEQWKDAEIDLKRDGKRFMGRRRAPFYKVLTGMPIAVDAFRYGAIPHVKAYFLTWVVTNYFPDSSHAHSDHYTNLSKSWRHGPIYCSLTTANLIVHMLGVEPQWVHGLPDDIPFEIPDTGGVTVTTIEANHCPGSSIFLFEGRQTVNAGDSGFSSAWVGTKRVFRYLHCGDFRASPKHVLHPAVAKAKVDTVYLDTTYLNPTYCFPPQPLVIQACAALARKTALGVSPDAPSYEDVKPDVKPDVKLDPDIRAELGIDRAEAEERSKALMQGWLVKQEDDVKQEPLVELKRKGRTLVMLGTYSIGKERIVKARALGSKIYCDSRKRGILMCQADPDLHAMLGTSPIDVHLVPLGNIQLDRLEPYLAALHPHFDRVLAFRPTGWTYTAPAGTNTAPDVNFVIRRDQARTFNESMLKPMRGSSHRIMMFEHSSFFELTCFALSMPGADLKMIATVNVGREARFEKWAAEKAKRKAKNLPAIVDYRDENYTKDVEEHITDAGSQTSAQPWSMSQYQFQEAYDEPAYASYGNGYVEAVYDDLQGQADFHGDSFDEDYDDPYDGHDININDDWDEFADLYPPEYIPLAEQVIVGRASDDERPLAQDVARAWCDLYPQECRAQGLEAPAFLNATAGNATDATPWKATTALAQADMTGLLVAAALVLLLLLGLSSGGDSARSSDKSDKMGPAELAQDAKNRQRNADSAAQNAKDAKKEADQAEADARRARRRADALPEGPEKDAATREAEKREREAERARKRADEAARNAGREQDTADAANDRASRARDQQASDRRNRKGDATGSSNQSSSDPNRPSSSRSGQTPEERRRRQDAENRSGSGGDPSKKNSGSGDPSRNATSGDPSKRSGSGDLSRSSSRDPNKGSSRDTSQGSSRDPSRSASSGNTADPNKGTSRPSGETPADRSTRRDDERRAREQARRDADARNRSNAGETPEQRDKRKEEEQRERDRKKKEEEARNRRAAGETPEERERRRERDRQERERQEKADKEKRDKEKRDKEKRDQEKRDKEKRDQEKRDKEKRDKEKRDKEQRDKEKRDKEDKAKREAERERQRREAEAQNRRDAGETPEERDERKRKQREERERQRQEEAGNRNRDPTSTRSSSSRSGEGGDSGPGAPFKMPPWALPVFLGLLLLALLGGGLQAGAVRRSGPLFSTPAAPIVADSGPMVLPSSAAARWAPPARNQIKINNINSNGGGAGIFETAEPVIEVVRDTPVSPPPPPPIAPLPVPDARALLPPTPSLFVPLLVAAGLALAPLLLDNLRGYPVHTYHPGRYMPPYIHYLLLLLACVLLVAMADRQFALSHTYAPVVQAVAAPLHNMVVSAAASSPTVGEAVEDVIFGDGRTVLGAVMAAVGLVMLSRRDPPMSGRAKTTTYLPGSHQLLCALGLGVIGSIFWNA